MENGQERVEVEEDGQLKSVSINGEWGGASGRKQGTHVAPASLGVGLANCHLHWWDALHLQGSLLCVSDAGH